MWFFDHIPEVGRRMERLAARLNLVAAWREAKVFTDAERAALELTEQGPRVADAGAGGVTDGVRANAAKHYDHESEWARSPTAFARIRTMGASR